MTRCFVHPLGLGSKESNETCLDQKIEGYMVELAEKQARTGPSRLLRKSLRNVQGQIGRENMTHFPIFGAGEHEKRGLEALGPHFMVTSTKIQAQKAYFGHSERSSRVKKVKIVSKINISKNCPGRWFLGSGKLENSFLWHFEQS